MVLLNTKHKKRRRKENKNEKVKVKHLLCVCVVRACMRKIVVRCLVLSGGAIPGPGSLMWARRTPVRTPSALTEQAKFGPHCYRYHPWAWASWPSLRWPIDTLGIARSCSTPRSWWRDDWCPAAPSLLLLLLLSEIWGTINVGTGKDPDTSNTREREKKV